MLNQFNSTDVRQFGIEGTCTDAVKTLNKPWLQPNMRIKILVVGKPSSTFPTSVTVVDLKDSSHISSLLLDEHLLLDKQAKDLLRSALPAPFRNLL